MVKRGETMLFMYFIIAASFVVFSATKVTRYVTAVNEKTNISAGFIGLIVFSMITSLPELLSSSYAVILGQPTMAFSNILGSNAFNLLILAIINLIFLKKRIFKHVSRSNKATTIMLIGLNVLVGLGLFLPIQLPIPFLNLSLASTLIFSVYFFIIYRSYHDSDSEESGENERSGLDHLSLQQVLTRGLIYTLIMILFSLMMTKISDQIVLTYPNIGATLVGSLMLAVATSLPEVVTTFSLCRMGQSNIAISGIIGSSLFNFNILFVTDLLSTKQSIFEQAANSPDLAILKLLVMLGIVLAVIISINFRLGSKLNKLSYILGSLLVVGSYFIFLQMMFL